jgi:hypothetical protein
VKLWMKTMWFGAFACVASLLPASLSAQDLKPAVVISLAPLEEQVNDTLYVAEAIGFKEQAQAGVGFVPLLTKGIDAKRPWGIYVLVASGEPVIVSFVPVTNLKDFVKTHEDKIGKPEDLGGGLFKFETPGQSVFIKDTAGWAYVSNSQESLATLPADPLAMLGDLPKNYNLAIKANVKDIPPELRDMALSQIEMGLAQGLENAGNDAEREFNKQWGEMSMTQMKRIFNEVETFTVGWNIDAAAKGIFVDGFLMPVPNTGMARQAATLQKGTTSEFAGFLMPNASAVGLTSAGIAAEDIEANVKMLQLLQGRAETEIDNDAGLDANSRVTAKDLIAQVFDVLVTTVKEGKMDYGAALVLQGKALNFAGGVHVSDGKKLEAAFSKLVDLAKNEPDFPEVKLNAGTHGDVTLHQLAVALPDPDAQKVFGEKLNISLGIGAKQLFFAFGAQGEELLKKGIDDSKTKVAQVNPPGQINIYLKPIMAFAAAMDDSGNPALQTIASNIQQAPAGSDEISIVSTGENNGVRSRIAIKEGVLKIIGDAIRAAQGG